MFRSQVPHAYDGRCAIGKINNAAFSCSTLGVHPDLTLRVRQEILEEVDGWMLKGGIQGVHNTPLAVVPSARAARPSKERLEARYAGFLAVS